MEKCKNELCDNLAPEGRLYCCDPCQRKAQNQRYNEKKAKKANGLHGTQLNEDNMDKDAQSNDNFGLQLLNPAAGMPVPKDEASVQYAMYDLRSKLDMAIAEVRRLNDKDEANKEKLYDKQREVDDLKRSIEKLTDEKNSKSEISQVLDGFRDNSGQIDLAGLGQLVKGAGEGLSAVLNKGAGASPQLAGLDTEIPAEIKEHVSVFSTWFAGIDAAQREAAWSVINAMASKPELVIQFQNIISNVSSTRQATN